LSSSFSATGVPLAVTVFKWAKPDAKAWAPETAYRNGKYYMRQLGATKWVWRSLTTKGPFEDARTDALADKARDENAGVEPIDPAVLAVKDGQSYLYFGTCVPKGGQR
jgi:beta-xylosidase